MRQRQRLKKKFFFEFGPACDGCGSIGASEDCHHSDNDDADERMFDIDAGAWILQFVKVVDDVSNVHAFDLCHGVYSKNLANGYNPHKIGIGGNCRWRKSTQIAKITQSSRGP